MPTYVEETVEQKYNQIRVGNLPFDISAKQITDYFEPFGKVLNLYLKRRVAMSSPHFLSNPFVFIVFEKRTSVDEVMANRPHRLGGRELTLRRHLPRNERCPREPMISVNRMLVRSVPGTNEAILPDDNMIADYFSAAGGKIVHLDRWDDRTVLIEFNDYDPVDVCCLERPHFINNQPIEITKYEDEQRSWNRAEPRLKSGSVRSDLRSISPAAAINDSHADTTLSPTPTLNINDQLAHLRSMYEKTTLDLEREHAQHVASLTAEWEQTAKECIRLQRSTLDCKQEQARLTEDNRRLQKLYSESLQEKPRVQAEGDRKLAEARRQYTMAKARYDKFKHDNH